MSLALPLTFWTGPVVAGWVGGTTLLEAEFDENSVTLCTFSDEVAFDFRDFATLRGMKGNMKV